jgi:hypothetical protein
MILLETLSLISLHFECTNIHKFVHFSYSEVKKVIEARITSIRHDFINLGMLKCWSRGSCSDGYDFLVFSYGSYSSLGMVFWFFHMAPAP